MNETHCYLCHLKGANWESREDRKPDATCRLCHKTLPKVISLSSQNIEHEKYLEGKISCHECHSHVVKGGGQVVESTCFKCHDFQERLQISKDKEKLHEIHVVAHVECFLCHDDIRHQIDHKAKVAGSDCRSCHLAKHSGVKMLYSGKGGLRTADKPSPMFYTGVDCIGCHNEPNPPSSRISRGGPSPPLSSAAWNAIAMNVMGTFWTNGNLSSKPDSGLWGKRWKGQRRKWVPNRKTRKRTNFIRRPDTTISS